MKKKMPLAFRWISFEGASVRAVLLASCLLSRVVTASAQQPPCTTLVHHPAVTHVVHHPAVTREVTHPPVFPVYHAAVTQMVQRPALMHDEYVEPVTHTEMVPAVTHTETVPAVTHTEWVEGYWDENDNWVEGYAVTVVDAEAYEITVVDAAAYEVTVVDAEGYWKTIVDAEAYEEELVIEPAYWEGSYQAGYVETVIDVAAWDETVVDVPAYDEYVPDDSGWAGFDEVTATNANGAWSPATNTVPAGDIFTQTRVVTRTHTTGERNPCGATRNESSYLETASESQQAMGVMLVTGGGGSGGGGSGGGGSATAGDIGTTFGPGLVLSELASNWRDVNADGFLDEVVVSGSSRFVSYVKNWNIDTAATVYNLNADFVNTFLGSVEPQDIWWMAPMFKDSATNQDVRTWVFNWPYEFSYIWHNESQIEVEGTLRFDFQAEAGEKYSVYQVDATGLWTVFIEGLQYPSSGRRIIDQQISPFQVHGSSFVLVRLGRLGGSIPAELDYDWELKDLPGYPVGRTWDGVTIEADFPNWNWANWPHNWCMPGNDGDPLSWSFAAGLPSPIELEEWQNAQELVIDEEIQKASRNAGGKWEDRIKILSRAGAITRLHPVRMVAAWLLTELSKAAMREGPWSWVVYEKVNSVTGAVYSGQTQGPGTPTQVVSARDAAHKDKNANGYGSAVIKAAVTTKGALSLTGWCAMMGREQMHIDYHGGAQSAGERTPEAAARRGHNRNRALDNKIRSPFSGYESDIGYTLYAVANVVFTNPTPGFSPFTGNPQKTKILPLLLDSVISKVSYPPTNYPN